MKILATVTRIGTVTAISAASLAFTSTGAQADTVVPLPGGTLSRTLVDGTVVTVNLVGESANINPSMGSTPLHRNAWVSASAQVEISGTNTDVGGSIYPGYVVGCQVSISGGGVNGGANGGADWSSGEASPTGGVDSGANLTLGPGQATSFYVLDLEAPDMYGAEMHNPYNWFAGSNGSVTWTDETIGLNGCAGYAQARSFVSVEVITPTVTTWVTLWGQPFSLG
ncbi:porin [Nocardia sp. SYP-A9097]|uniref:MspA family porin n=1 Tax=Nocardia sp. SYP-A9097 TaxID=2663237 RepID=UPI00129A9F1D|nr:MspA family porin [Nocardia sp. SYP-A9097]MRH89794.1 porin [Nocardia sp. SYP-A9097]